ncbi:DNA polymerase IV [Clostridium perfringens]|uniref:DNA polymerase IV n=1 Tax=Clostridium perfringens TaxID=1502 RepID=UPI001A240156|nr:DNA polymerase IV [Clostridium perfringens]WFB43777.1 DNA polymerase IV [Clostridium perfringens]WFD75345.1 DNA polymerase IV [Clostridium perfringens]WFD83899.1 DNA polymerase IV [Clostridium perfringens]WFD96716.1 DNA polymerase IV [Clostridium perfringens]HAT4201221.1 DNA polymerase IV [Clostridium perfringens]
MKENRKIIHIDMDAFYASIEQRDNPKYKGKPLIVGGDPNRRGVVATCSYEARKYGIHSAMPSLTAYKLCPKAIFIRPRMEVYKKVSRQVMNILNEYSNLVEPLSLDEAFVDVSKSKRCKGSATLIALEIKERIFKEVGLTASAGVSFNKFLAKMASDFRKPDGITVITEENSKDFIRKLPIGKFFGVGRVTKNKLNNIGVFKGEDLLGFSEKELIGILGDRGKILYEFARGIDNRQVNPYRIRKSIGKEITLREDIEDIEEMIEILEKIAERVSESLCLLNKKGKTVTLKVKFNDFKHITRSITLEHFLKEQKEIMECVKDLISIVNFKNKKVRLLGITISSLEENIIIEEREQLSFDV